MILIGMFDSPFVRRVAVSMNLLGMAFEHRNWSVGKDFDQIRQFNPLGRVPTLVPPGGEALVESNAILDYLDECAGPERALVPRSGKDRREPAPRDRVPRAPSAFGCCSDPSRDGGASPRAEIPSHTPAPRPSQPPRWPSP